MFKAKNNLRHEDIEFNRMISLLRDEYRGIFNTLTNTYGIIRNTSTGGGVWAVTKSGDNTVAIAAGAAIVLDQDNKVSFVELLSAYTVNIPTTDGVYKVLFKQATHNYEKGTITLTNGSNTVTGSGTEFTKIFGPNRQLIVNGTSYPIMSVIDDTTLLLYGDYMDSTASGLQFIVGGYFTTNPSAVADNYIYEHDGLEILVTTDSVGANEYYLADVTVGGNIITVVTDKRDENLFAFNTAATSYVVLPYTWTVAGDVAVASGDIDYINPFFVAAPVNQTVEITGVLVRCNSGSCNIKISKTAWTGLTTDISDFTNINVSNASSLISPAAAIALSDQDYLRPVVNSTSSAKNLTITLFIKYSITQ